MAELEADFRVGLGVDEVDDPLPRRDMLGRVHAGAAWRDPPFRRNAGHFGDDQAGAALGARAVVDEVEVVGRAVDRPNTCAIGETTTRFSSVRSRRRNGANIGGRDVAGLLAVACSWNHLSAPSSQRRSRSAQILVADALRAGEQRISELHRIEVEVALEGLEPFGRVARRVLQLEHLGAPLLLILASAAAQRRLGCAGTSASLMALSSASLVPEPIEKWAVCGGVAEQDDVLVRPALAEDAPEVEPRRSAQMAARWSSADGRRGAVAKIRSHAAIVSLLAHRVEAEPPPGGFRAFDDEGRGLGVELVGVRPDPAVLGLLEDEGEGVLEPLAVPSQMNLLARTSMSGLKMSARRCESSSSRRRRR